MKSSIYLLESNNFIYHFKYNLMGTLDRKKKIIAILKIYTAGFQ